MAPLKWAGDIEATGGVLRGSQSVIGIDPGGTETLRVAGGARCSYLRAGNRSYVYDGGTDAGIAVPASTVTTVYSLATGGQSSALVLVTGVDGAGNWFSDLVHVLNSNAPAVLRSGGGGAPGVRTYSMAGANLQLSIPTAQLRVRAIGISTDPSA